MSSDNFKRMYKYMTQIYTELTDHTLTSSFICHIEEV